MKIVYVLFRKGHDDTGNTIRGQRVNKVINVTVKQAGSETVNWSGTKKKLQDKFSSLYRPNGAFSKLNPVLFVISRQRTQLAPLKELVCSRYQKYLRYLDVDAEISQLLYKPPVYNSTATTSTQEDQLKDNHNNRIVKAYHALVMDGNQQLKTHMLHRYCSDVDDGTAQLTHDQEFKMMCEITDTAVKVLPDIADSVKARCRLGRPSASKQQQRVIDEILGKFAQYNCVVLCMPGAGKTWLITRILHIHVNELKQLKLKNVWVATFNKTLVTPIGLAYNSHITLPTSTSRPLLGNIKVENNASRRVASTFDSLAHKILHEVDFSSHHLDAVQNGGYARRLYECQDDQSVTRQCKWHALKDLELIFVDEVQDLQPPHLLILELIAKMSPGVRIIAFGDTRQFIWESLGASPANTLDLLNGLGGRESRNTTPILESRRCMKQVCDFGTRVMSGIIWDHPANQAHRPLQALTGGEMVPVKRNANKTAAIHRVKSKSRSASVIAHKVFEHIKSVASKSNVDVGILSSAVNGDSIVARACRELETLLTSEYGANAVYSHIESEGRGDFDHIRRRFEIRSVDTSKGLTIGYVVLMPCVSMPLYHRSCYQGSHASELVHRDTYFTEALYTSACKLFVGITRAVEGICFVDFPVQHNIIEWPPVPGQESEWVRLPELRCLQANPGPRMWKAKSSTPYVYSVTKLVEEHQRSQDTQFTLFDDCREQRGRSRTVTRRALMGFGSTRPIQHPFDDGLDVLKREETHLWTSYGCMMEKLLADELGLNKEKRIRYPDVWITNQEQSSPSNDVTCDPIKLSDQIRERYKKMTGTDPLSIKGLLGRVTTRKLVELQRNAFATESATSMVQKGPLVRAWNHVRYFAEPTKTAYHAYTFTEKELGGDRLLEHIRRLASGVRRLVPGEEIKYQVKAGIATVNERWKDGTLTTVGGVTGVMDFTCGHVIIEAKTFTNESKFMDAGSAAFDQAYLYGKLQQGVGARGEAHHTQQQLVLSMLSGYVYQRHVTESKTEHPAGGRGMRINTEPVIVSTRKRKFQDISSMCGEGDESPPPVGWLESCVASDDDEFDQDEFLHEMYG